MPVIQSIKNTYQKKKKEDEIKLTDTIKNDTENLKTEMTKKIVELNDQIASNKVKEEEIKTQVKIAEGKLEEILEKIKIREEELKKMGIDVKKEEENKNSSKKNVTLNENQVIQEEKKDGGKTNQKIIKKYLTILVQLQTVKKKQEQIVIKIFYLGMKILQISNQQQNLSLMIKKEKLEKIIFTNK